jgi:DNA repair protein RecO (recombination protein O)
VWPSGYLEYMPLVATEAVVLYRFDYLESSRIVRLATRDLGVQSALARGARRPGSRFGHALDVFASGVAHLSVRPGRDLSTLTAFELMRFRSAIGSDLDRFTAASALAELALRFGHAGAPDPSFETLVAALDAVAGAPAGTAIEAGLGGAWRYVAALGFAPSVERCAACHAVLVGGETVPFSYSQGGVLCQRCASGRTGAVRYVPPRALAAIRSWLGGGGAELADTSERRAHLRLLREFVQHHLAGEARLGALLAWEERARAGV